MNLKIAVIKGDGIGPEIVTEAMKVLDKVAKRYGHNIEYRQLLNGWSFHRCAWCSSYR